MCYRSQANSLALRELSCPVEVSALFCRIIMKSIPVVDIRSTFVPGEGNWTSVAEKLTDALHETGFLYLTGHGIDLDLVKVNLCSF